MFTFSALIYDGYKQQLVSGDYESQIQFNAFLDARFGVYVCMWITQEPTQKVVDAMLYASINVKKAYNLKAK